MYHGDSVAKVSVIIPIYGVAPFLSQCVDSVLGQSMCELEVLLIDDGSRDGCAAICDDYARRDPRVRVIHQQNAGVSVARNRGLEAASAEWVMFVDGDDWLERDAVESLYQLAVAHDCDIAVSNHVKELAEGSVPAGCTEATFVWEMAAHREELVGEAILSAGYYRPAVCPERAVQILAHAVPWARLFRRRLLEEHEIRYLPGLKQHEDLLFNLYAFMAARRVCVTDRALVHYRLWEGSVTLQIRDDQEQIYLRLLSELREFTARYRQTVDFTAYCNVRVFVMVYDLISYILAGVHGFELFRKGRRRLKEFAEQPEIRQALREVDGSVLFPKKRVLAALVRSGLYGAALGGRKAAAKLSAGG